MSDEMQDSIRGPLDRLQHGDSTAANSIWTDYFSRLAQIADDALASGVRRTVDGEDIALSVIQTICRRAKIGQLANINNQDDLWRMMITILHHKAADRGREHRSQKRGGGKVRGDSVFLGSGTEAERMAFAQFADATPTPDLLVELEEQRRTLFDLLGDEELRHIAQQRLEGATIKEIAATLDVSPSTIRRKLESIRKRWSHVTA